MGQIFHLRGEKGSYSEIRNDSASKSLTAGERRLVKRSLLKKFNQRRAERPISSLIIKKSLARKGKNFQKKRSSGYLDRGGHYQAPPKPHRENGRSPAHWQGSHQGTGTCVLAVAIPAGGSMHDKRKKEES